MLPIPRARRARVFVMMDMTLHTTVKFVYLVVQDQGVKRKLVVIAEQLTLTIPAQEPARAQVIGTPLPNVQLVLLEDLVMGALHKLVMVVEQLM